MKPTSTPQPSLKTEQEPVAQRAVDPVAPGQISLRDFFAAHALATLPRAGAGANVDMVASSAYKLADAMLTARTRNRE